MNRFSRVTLTVSALSLSLVLAGCETFDPTSILDMEIFNTKKKLPGERQAVFPEGTPGVSQGVPQEMVKGYQPPKHRRRKASGPIRRGSSQRVVAAAGRVLDSRRARPPGPIHQRNADCSHPRQRA